MFLSLKGALGRNPMINRVGQRLLQAFEGASAAYSLRDLASNIASVVRVRRASDNSEADFSAADVSSGAMTQWVNAQIVPPLDIRELVDGERTGDLVEAAAAYSLRNLSSTYTGNVVDVRRSSDDTEESFTAAEVADGTLTDWVNTTTDVISLLDGTVLSRFYGTGSLTNASATSANFSAGSSGLGVRNSPYSIFSSSLNAQDRLELNITVSGSTAFQVRLRTSTHGGASAWTQLNNGTATYTIEVTSANAEYLEFSISSTAGGSFTINGLSKLSNDGFVTKWYDQSGNDNHATQGTDASQPKIVDGGSLVSGGLDFDGVNDKLSFDSSVSLSTNDFYFASVISILDGDREDITPVGNAAGNRFLISLDYDNDAAQMRANDGTFLTQPFTRIVPANETLISISTVSNTATLRCEGISAAVFNTTGESFTLGSMGQITPSAYSKHSIKELIIYDSDQSDNRTAFEANIGETYNIDLPSGVDTGYDQVDGFVETWYDQSGNGNDAVQQVSGRQPKIVDAGSLLADGIDFESGKNLPLSGPGLDIFKNVSYGQIFSTIKPRNTSTGSNRYFEATIGVGAGARFLFADGQDTAGTFRIGGRRLDGDSFGDEESPTGHSNQLSLLTGFVNYADAEGFLFLDGAQVATSSIPSMTAGNTSDTSSQSVAIGGANQLNTASFNAKELIIYTTDQSANREAIETNINNQYDIY